MKALHIKSILLILTMSLVIVSCGNETKNNGEDSAYKSSTTVEKIKTANNFVKGARDLTAESEALKKLIPIPVETFKAFFPETIYGLPKTNSNAMDMAGATTGFATYGQNTSKQINIQIVDGAGEKGSAATGVFRAIKYDKTNTESNGDYSKVKEYEGVAVREDFDQGQNRYTLTLFSNERFAIKLKVTGFEQKDVWTIFKAFNLNNLTN